MDTLLKTFTRYAITIHVREAQIGDTIPADATPNVCGMQGDNRAFLQWFCPELEGTELDCVESDFRYTFVRGAKLLSENVADCICCTLVDCRQKAHTVADLIAYLQTCDPSAKVILEGCCQGDWAGYGESEQDPPVVLLRRYN